MIDGLWEKANEVSEVGYKLDSIAGVAEILAERLSDNAESGACWAIAEMIKQYGERLERLSEDIMAINRVANEQIVDAEIKLGKLKAVVANAKKKVKK
jgi:hypothetical protein